MKTTYFAIPLCLLAATPLTAEVTFDWATVGNAGNAADPETGFGSVGYDFRISKTEVTNAQYVEFLNAVDPTGANALDLFTDVGFDGGMTGNFGGIEKTGTVDGARYIAQAGREQNPVTFVSFFDAMRFTNWLHNGQGSGDTETGAYKIGSGIDEVRSAGAEYWIPSEDEWYKAAYHDSSAGTAGVYFDYATGSDTLPVSDQPSDNPAAVNYRNNDNVANGFNDGFALSGPSLSLVTSPLTDVGAYTGASSPYGTFDQNGNVQEWTEEVRFSNFRGWRGGSWFMDSSRLRASFDFFNAPQIENDITGFRVATLVPEPTSAALALIAVAGVGWRPRTSPGILNGEA